MSPLTPGRAVRTARRVAPFALEAWRRWERLPEVEKERYRHRVRDATKRGRTVIEERRRRGGGPGGMPPPSGPAGR